MRIFKHPTARLACLLIALTVMSGCSNSMQAPTTSPTMNEQLPTVSLATEVTEPAALGIEKDAYSGSDMAQFTVDEEVTYIADGAFANCNALENFYCASRDISIHENAFSGTKNIVFHCYLDSTVDMFAREHGYARVYFDAFSVQCDTVNNGCAGLPITWSAVDVMPGQNIASRFVYTLYLNEEPIFTSEPTAEDSFTYTPTEGGQYTVTVEISNDLTTTSLSSAVVPVADRLTMGLYEQDDDDTATEPIEWRVLTVEDGKALVLSEHILTRGSFFNPEWIKYKYTYWAQSCVAETSSTNYWGSAPEDPKRRIDNLTPESVPNGWHGERVPEADLFYVHARYWCNETFYKEHFTDEERERILLSDLTNPENPKFHTKGGPETQDYVFFLSYEEVKAYLPTKADRKASFSTYAANQPFYYGGGYDCYWLRSPGLTQYCAMCVWGIPGEMDYYGSDVGHNILGYRPAMWITIGG